MEQTIESKLKKFIQDNGLTFEEGQRNRDSVIISGYALYLGVQDPGIIENLLEEEYPDVADGELFDEIERVFAYAKLKNYEKFWYREEAKTMYKF